MANLLFLEPKGMRAGQPSYERIMAFQQFYKSHGAHVQSYTTPTHLFALLQLVFFCKKNAIDYLFISMPPFRVWLLFLFFKNKVILDIRDGWSIAMQTGYGGTAKPAPFKAKLARMVERFAIQRAACSITCTPGLQTHLEKVSGKPLLLILNGVSKENFQYIQQTKESITKQDEPNTLNIICAGKFSEYGQDKVKHILQLLTIQFPNQHINLNVLGANKAANKWIHNYIQSKKYRQISFKLWDRQPKEKMYPAILSSDIAISLVRNPNYEFGTKVFEYILCQTPILYYFDDHNPFSAYFQGFFYEKDKQIDYKDIEERFIRENILEHNKNVLLKVLTL